MRVAKLIHVIRIYLFISEGIIEVDGADLKCRHVVDAVDGMLFRLYILSDTNMYNCKKQSREP